MTTFAPGPAPTSIPPGPTAPAASFAIVAAFLAMADRLGRNNTPFFVETSEA